MKIVLQSVRNTILAVIGLMSIGHLVFVAVSTWTLAQVQIGGPLYERIARAKGLAADILPPPLNAAPANRLLHHLLIEQEPARMQEHLQGFARVKEEFESRAQYWQAQPLDDPLRAALVDHIIPTGRTFLARAETEVLPAVKAGQYARATALYHERLVPLYNRHELAVQQAVGLALAQTEASESTAKAQLGVWTAWLLLTAVGVLFLGVVASWALTYRVIRPVQRIHAFLTSLKDSHDLTRRLPVAGFDEISQVSRDLNLTLDHFARTVGTVRASTLNVASMAQELSIQTQLLVTGRENQVFHAQEASKGVTQISSSAAFVSEHAKGVAAESDQASAAAKESHQIVKRSLEDMGAIGETIRRSADRIGRLGERSEQVGRIVGMIEDIADQTNLLALNAAIEAARAGDQGRGFAVVADEVRKLAERTTRATKEISDTIRTIQSETESSTQAMHEATYATANGLDLSKLAGERLETIIFTVNNLTAMMQQIAQTISTQSSSTSQIAHNIDGLATVLQHGESHLSELNGTTQRLADLTTRLWQSVTTFKVDNEATDDSSRENVGASGASIKDQHRDALA